MISPPLTNGTAKASSLWSNSRFAEDAFKRNNKWWASAEQPGPHWISYTFPEPVRVLELALKGYPSLKEFTV